MPKAKRELADLMPSQSVVIEVLDARMPAASANPVVAELRRDKPCVKVLSKSDLADPDVTQMWLRHFEADDRVLAIATSLANAAEARVRVPALCEQISKRTRGAKKTTRAVIVGVPNVGKSTLTNTLMGRKVAAASDVPAVTKIRQQVELPGGMVLSDNPGLLSPKIEDNAATMRLALCAAIPDTADYESVALFGAKYFLERYPALLMARYKLKDLPLAHRAHRRDRASPGVPPRGRRDRDLQGREHPRSRLSLGRARARRPRAPALGDRPHAQRRARRARRARRGRAVVTTSRRRVRCARAAMR